MHDCAAVKLIRNNNGTTTVCGALTAITAAPPPQSVVHSLTTATVGWLCGQPTVNFVSASGVLHASAVKALHIYTHGYTYVGQLSEFGVSTCVWHAVATGLHLYLDVTCPNRYLRPDWRLGNGSEFSDTFSEAFSWIISANFNGVCRCRGWIGAWRIYHGWAL